MNLYLDIRKAVQVPSVSTDSIEGDRAARQHDSSFSRQSSGVIGGDASGDDPEVGKKWKDGDVDDDEKSDSQIAEEKGITVKPDTKKSEAVDMLKSMRYGLEAQLQLSAPNSREVEYLTTECGYTHEEVVKGLAVISGAERNRFNTWLQNKFVNAVSRLSK
jgi:hypothetical protein